MRKSPKSSNPPPLRGREARPQGARVGGRHAPCLQAKIEICHRDSRDIFERTLRPQSSGSGSSCAAAKLKTAAFAGRCRLAPSSSTLHASNESFLLKSTVASTPGENCMMLGGLGGWSPGVIAFSESQTPMSCGTSKRYCRISDQHLSLERTPLRILLRRMLPPPQGGRVD